MEDENDLELSLGLSCGRLSWKSKIVDISSVPKLEAGGRSDTKDSDQSFKNFFQTGSEKQDSKGKQKSDPVLAQNENFWTDLRKCSASAFATDASHDVHHNLSQFTRYQELWTSKAQTADSEENPNKRKMPFEDISFQNKHDKLLEYTNAPYRNPASFNIISNFQVPNQTEDISLGENEEDVAESETEGSNSWLMYNPEDKSKCFGIAKFTDKHVLSDSSVIGSKGQKESSLSRTEANHASREVEYGIPSSLQPRMTVPYPVSVKVATTTNVPNSTVFPSPCVMQGMPVMTDDRPSSLAPNSSNLQLTFGYSSVQLPTLETDSSWAFNSQHSKVTSLANKDHVDGAPSSEHSDVKMSHVSGHSPHISSPALVYQGTPSELANINGKHGGEVGSYSKIQEGKENSSIFRPKERTQPAVDGFLQQGSTIKEGIAPEIKFGRSGSSPNLPWVSTTGSGPNGRTISGVPYKYNQNQVKIVCACHGTHMSQEEFVRHASAYAPKQEDDAKNHPAASAKS
ncbi:ninja-family protein-like [Iris pallida]|uniref:Ninja-family protein n=1 Tax=Iris pallida TaxID=29817 RepID=A0AAX6DKX2_IRIPA|nr:ninja-family protein-like [Iris pallida]